jgi:Formiminotransferase-cyclodeaminase
MNGPGSGITVRSVIRLEWADIRCREDTQYNPGLPNTLRGSVPNAPPSDATADSPPVAELTVIEFVTRLGTAMPAPGSGAAGAVALALAAACAAKAFAVSQRHNRIEALVGATTRAQELARIALDGAQHDGDDFRRWLKLHSAAAAATLDEDSRGLFCLSAALRDLISDHRRDVLPSLAADLDAALELASSFDAIAKKNATELRASAP